MFVDGRIEATSHKFESDIRARTVGVSGIIKRYAGPECIGGCIEEPFSGQFSSLKACFPMRGAAVLACELAGLPWSAINLSKLKLHATGKGNAKKPEMPAAAKARWGVDRKEDKLAPRGPERMRWVRAF